MQRAIERSLAPLQRELVCADAMQRAKLRGTAVAQRAQPTLARAKRASLRPRANPARCRQPRVFLGKYRTFSQFALVRKYRRCDSQPRARRALGAAPWPR